MQLLSMLLSTLGRQDRLGSFDGALFRCVSYRNLGYGVSHDQLARVGDPEDRPEIWRR